MQISHQIELPEPEAFYTEAREFDVVLDIAACGQHTLRSPKPINFSVPYPTLLAPQLTTAAQKSPHKASLEDISTASLRFYRSGGVTPFAPADYAANLFITRYNWGLAFQRSNQNSVEHRPPGGVLHSEALKFHTELFAYGLSVNFVAKHLGISLDRFFFITAAGSRADFEFKVTQQDLVASSGTVAALAPSGHIVSLEVKARTGWATHRHLSDEGLRLLHNLSEKAGRDPTRVFLSTVVALPSSPPSKRSRAKIILADPGDPEPMAPNSQLVLLLEESITMLLRHGLWPTLASVLSWLCALRGSLTPAETALQASVSRFHGQLQYRIYERIRDDRIYNGRIFSDVVLRLGQPGNRGMNYNEAEQRLANDELGGAWYSGVDKEWIRIVQERGADALLAFGTRGSDSASLVGRSAFLLEKEPMDDDLRAGVRNELRSAIFRW